MSFISIISALLFVSRVFAVEYNPGLDAKLEQLVQHGGFYKVGEIPIAPKNLDRAAHATFRISPEGGTCSAVFLSNDGYVATALHCVQQCFRPKWNYKPPVVSNEMSRTGVYTAVQIPLQTPPEMNCPDLNSANFWNYEYNLDNPQLVFVGRGTLTNNEKELVKISDDEFNSIKDVDEDIAILKYENKTGRPLPCIPAARSMPQVKAPVWAIGFPVRGPGFDYDGYRKAVSVGRAKASIVEDPILIQYANDINPQDVDRFWNYQQALWNHPRFLITNTDAAHGSSGGLMVDQNGEFVGVAFSITRGDNFYNGGSLLGFSAAYLRDELTRFLGKEKSDAIFNCSSEPNSPVHDLVQSSL